MARSPEERDASWAFVAPSDLRSHDLPSQAARGFHRGSTDELLNRAADTIERLNTELAEIRQARESWKRERDRLEGQLDEAKTRAELLVGEAMLDAHKATQALKAEAEADAAAIRAEAQALLEPARQEATRLVAEAHEEATRIVATAEAERDRLAAEGEQYKLLSADVQQRSVAFLQRALQALGNEGAVAPEISEEEIAPFRKPDQQAAGD